ncbi:YraN family protein [Arsenicicoccus piscis]|uniref:UPF0102 protein GCM10025862_11180 n=1 Tax=Arsenicicoccus piscis TaxID=673954 RepID=A0ABQ6HM83_9MICO|nr:YraN family protein [Arsenicicoccus piscis]GMA19097.1 UPF0102 protein [Arsenicicoccus piscis]
MGRFGEDLACARFLEAGLSIVERNWRCPLGEIDIVALDGGTLVVAEVKTRRSTGFGTPVEQITHAKLVRLRRLAARWLQEHPSLWVQGVRVDVVGVYVPPRGAPEVEHLKAVL